MPTLMAPTNPSFRSYMDDRVSFLRHFPDEAFLHKEYATFFYPYSVTWTSEERESLRRSHHAIWRATTALINGATTDAALRDELGLGHLEQKLLRDLKEVPFTTGFMRPDFLIAEDGSFQFCEINTRFPFNGYYMSIFSERAQNQGAQVSDKELRSLCECLEALEQRKSVVLKHRERGFDIKSFLYRAPHSSQAEATRFFEENLGLASNSALILELHQEELEKVLDNVVEQMKRGVPCVNDPRAVMIVHGRRFFAALYRHAFEGEHVHPDDQKILQSCIIPTFVPREAAEIVKQAKERPHDWLLKRHYSGKGDGVYFGRHLTKSVWREYLKQEDMVLQPYIPQKLFEVWDPDTQTVRELPLVGVTLGWGEGESTIGLLRCVEENPLDGFAMVASKSGVSDA